MSFSSNNPFAPLQDGEEDDIMRTQGDGWDDDVSVSNDSNSDNDGKGTTQAKEGSRKKTQIILTSTINPDGLEAAAIAIGFPILTGRAS